MGEMGLRQPFFRFFVFSFKRDYPEFWRFVFSFKRDYPEFPAAPKIRKPRPLLGPLSAEWTSTSDRSCFRDMFSVHMDLLLKSLTPYRNRDFKREREILPSEVTDSIQKLRLKEREMDQVDRLSALPECLLHHILSFLDMKDVILAGLSSTGLREISTSVPNLHFDIRKSDCEEDFVKFVYQTIGLSSAPEIHKFQLRSPCDSKYVPHIDAWISFAIQKGVRELDLFFLDPYELPSSLRRAGLSSTGLREISTSVPNLLFDIRKSDCEEDFVKFVNQTIGLSSAPKIHKFQLRSPCDSEYVPHIDAWISFAIKKGVRELDLCFLDPYELPSSLPSCETLVSLNLKNCAFSVSNFAMFSKLTSFHLSSEFISDGLVEHLLKECPLLEELSIEGYFLCPPMKIRSSLSSSSSTSLPLKRLTIEGGHNESIEIEAPNLQFLKIRSGNVGRCSFGYMGFLREAYIDVSYPPGSTSEFISILESSLQNLRHASVLKLSSTCLQVMPIPTFEDPHSYFFKTKHLILRTRVQKYEIPGIANLLWSSPDLENLVIDLVPSNCICDKECNNKYDFDEREYWESLTATFQCLVHQLKTIKITGFMGGDSLDPGIKGTSFHVKDEQIKLVKFLLKNAMVLKKMTVHFSRAKCVRVEQWVEMMLSVTEKLIAFPRASSHAEVLFQDECNLLSLFKMNVSF